LAEAELLPELRQPDEKMRYVPDDKGHQQTLEQVADWFEIRILRRLLPLVHGMRRVAADSYPKSRHINASLEAKQQWLNGNDLSNPVQN
jgi:hypothetical protein